MDIWDGYPKSSGTTGKCEIDTCRQETDTWEVEWPDHSTWRRYTTAVRSDDWSEAGRRIADLMTRTGPGNWHIHTNWIKGRYKILATWHPA